jgi:hypothetical protein
MTPDDMEGRIKRLAALVENDECHWNMDGPPESDCVDVLVSDLRALLLDYQERGRALDPFAAVADKCPENWPDQTTPGLVTLGDCRHARATLKGKSHD